MNLTRTCEDARSTPMNPESQSLPPAGGLLAAERLRLEYDALTRQLERMRAMQYAYNRKFFALLLVSTLVSLGLLLWDYWLTGWVVSFGLVTTGFTASFFLHFCDFARVHARALETRINALLGSRALIASELEADYFYPHASPKLSGFSFDRPMSFFSVYTLHFCGVWGGFVVWSAIKVNRYFSDSVLVGGAVLWVIWTCMHVAYLHWWFGDSEAETRMARRLAENYGLRQEDAPPEKSQSR